MGIIIEHEKRRREILEKAMDVFIEDGFGDATIQKIAGRCGISRPILYTYFRNKREIFSYSIKQLLSEVEQAILRETKAQKAAGKTGAPENLLSVLALIFDTLEKNRPVLGVLLDYLLYIAKHPGPLPCRTPEYLIRKRTIKMRHILSEIIIDGIKAGEIKNISVSEINNLIYAILESAILNVTVVGKNSLTDAQKAAELTVRFLSTH
ncbi:MAG: TetR/AcrR family transcriptional regulator [Spirochaetaceae bacterium]|jgi:AcrR family transcriptional regulator|nr:TetR/AcrR family transcriptional regulator [Spirochaetaceae bacterium]